VLVGQNRSADKEPSMNEITTVGLDLAKNVFQVHGVDAEGTTVLRKQLRRAQVLAFFSRLPRCLVGMEACATAHYWARELRALRHEVRLMPAQYVKAYVKRNKNDAADAEAICEAVVRPTMRFVPAKTAEQQAAVLLHRGPAHDAGECSARASCGVRSDRPAGLTQCWQADCYHPR
jgi:transposase